MLTISIIGRKECYSKLRIVIYGSKLLKKLNIMLTELHISQQ
jgi:hypothetical protein